MLVTDSCAVKELYFVQNCVISVIASSSHLFFFLLFSFIPSDEIDDEDGELKEKDDHEHRQTSEQEKNRVTWNTERRCFMDASATKRYVFTITCTYINRCSIWLLMVMGNKKYGKKI